MPDLETSLSRWQSAGILDAAQAAQIRAHESAYRSSQSKPTGLRWQSLVALLLGAILLATGVALFVSAHWDELSPIARFALVLSTISAFHLAAAIARSSYRTLSTTLHAVGTLATGAAIALVGQIFHIQEHWPAAILIWALAASAGWALLRDEAQQTLTVLLLPTWLFSEWEYATEYVHGGDVYLARMIAVWAVLYLTLWLHSRREVVWGLTFAASAIAFIVANILLLQGWSWYYANTGYLSLTQRICGWILIAVLPALVALIRMKQSLVPVLVTIIASAILPFCQTQASMTYFNGQKMTTYTHSMPSLAAHALVAAIAIILAWWGVRQSSQSLVNYGIVCFAVTVGWFYFSNLFDKLGRSLGLISLGILFLAGGWLLEKTRRRLITCMKPATAEPS